MGIEKRSWLLAGLVGIACVAACSSSNEDTRPGPGPQNTSLPTSNLDDIKWNPEFPADVNELKPRDGVDVVDERLTNGVTVLDNELRFPAATSQDVGNWSPGRIVVSAPSAISGNGSNAFGFARRVVSVNRVADTFVVATERLNLSDVVTGDLRVRLDNNTSMADADLTKVDLAWAAKNLYDNHPNNFFFPSFEGLVDDAPQAPEGLSGQANGGALRPQFSLGGALRTVGSAVGGAAQKLADTTQDVVSEVTPANFTGAGDFKTEVSGAFEPRTFLKDFSYEKQIRERPAVTVGVRINRMALKSGSFKLNPGLQLSLSVPNPVNNQADPLSVKMGVSARSEFRAEFDYDIEAFARSGDGGGVELGDLGLNRELDRISASAAEKKAIYDEVHKAVFGDPDLKLPGGWRKLLYITKPKVLYVQAGPVPVVITVTVQFDLQCGFMAKGSVKGELAFSHAGSFGFSGGYVKGGAPNITPPAFSQATNVDKNTMSGGGEFTIACGVVPRLNALIYDSVGVGVGVRSSLGVKITPRRICPGSDARPASPRGQFDMDFSAELATQLSGRVQVPGASALQKAGDDLGAEIGPAEPFFKSFPLGTTKRDIGTIFGVCPGAPGAPEKPGGPACGGASPPCEQNAGCRANSDCARPATCSNGVCGIGVSCSNGVQDGLETGPDCGGTCPNKCGIGAGCSADADCAVGTCSRRTWQCVADRCNDGQKNGDEAGVDCGGPTCRKCRNGEFCSRDNGATPDCESGYVYSFYCAKDSCSNGAKDPNESDVDCGGTSSCAKCGGGSLCASTADCQAGMPCTNGRCKTPVCQGSVKGSPGPACTDTIQNCSETDVDCGGICFKCATGKKCISGGDCSSGICTSGTCAEATCSDGVKNGSETAPDCGGSSCAKCGAGKACNVGADCASGTCAGGACTAPSCSDGVKNGAETDVDCGGGVCGKCGLNRSCAVPSDCSLNFCVSGTCRDSSCSDGVRTGSETDVDCGGPNCGKCANGKACNLDAECLSSVCMGSVCQAPTCSDGRKNATESDIDCGGATCSKCVAGKACSMANDCASNICQGGVCAALQCQNGVKDGAETDVDCGGPICGKCGEGKTCAATSDCETDVAMCSPSLAKCVRYASCFDQAKNFSEAGPDCGGDVCIRAGGTFCNASNTAAGTWNANPGLDNVGLGDVSIWVDVLLNGGTDIALADQRADCANSSNPRWMMVVDGNGMLSVFVQGAGQTLFMNSSPYRINDNRQHRIRFTRHQGVFYLTIDHQVGLGPVATAADPGLNLTGMMPAPRAGTNNCAQYAPFPTGVGANALSGPFFLRPQ